MNGPTFFVIKKDPENPGQVLLLCPFCDEAQFYGLESFRADIGDTVTCANCSRAFEIKEKHFKGPTE